MEWPTTTFAVFLLLLLRVVVPIAVTITFISLLKWLDERWKKEADVETSQLVKVGNVGCWEINNCPDEWRDKCIVWELKIRSFCWFMNGTFCQGQMQGSWDNKVTICRDCEVYRSIFPVDLASISDFTDYSI